MAIIKLNNRAVKDATAFGSITGLGNLVFISRSSASSSASLSITSGISSTYKEYIFYFNNIHPATQSAFQFNLSIDTGSNYNVTKTATYFRAHHNESGSSSILGGEFGNATHQETTYQNLGDSTGTDNDQSLSGYLHLFEPSSDTFVKHFMSVINDYNGSDFNRNCLISGYGNTTSAINAIDFKMASGNIDAGTIDMYGVA